LNEELPVEFARRGAEFPLEDEVIDRPMKERRLVEKGSSQPIPGLESGH